MPELTAQVPREAASFVGLYERHYPEVYRYALIMTRSHDDAEEIASETFLRAFSAWTEQYPPRPLAWLYLVARRISTDRWRRSRRLLAILQGRLRRNVNSDLSQSEFWVWFDQVSRIMPERQREVLVLRYARDLDDSDIGRIMNLSEAGVRSLVRRSLETLRRNPEVLRDKHG